MGAMKAIYTDCQELREFAVRHDDDETAEYIERTGWITPTEVSFARRDFLDIITELSAVSTTAQACGTLQRLQDRAGRLLGFTPQQIAEHYRGRALNARLAANDGAGESAA